MRGWVCGSELGDDSSSAFIGCLTNLVAGWSKTA